MKLQIQSDCRDMPDVTDVVERIFEDRNIEDPWHFLNPTEDDMLPFEDLKNIDEAAQIILRAVEYDERIGVVADVDCDGITSCSIIYRYLKKLKPELDIKTYINHGKSHGLQRNDLEKYKDRNLLIIVDSLDPTAFNYEEVQINSDITDVVVLDHHTINPKIPYDKWITLVSSQQDYGNPELSGAGVCMKFILYLDKILGLDYAEEFYDLAATGILADVMDVTVPENRYIISRGLEEIHNPAIQKLAGGFDWNSKSVLFSIGPAINSTMRLDKNEYSLRAFLADDNKEVLENVRELKKCKEKQNQEIDSIMEDVTEQCNKQLNNKMIIVFITTENGIAGLIGSRLLEKYKRPIIVLKEFDDCYKGSMRATGVDDFQAMINESGLAESFGHPLAAGVDIEKKNFKAFCDYMERILPDVGEFEETISADIWVRPENIDRNFIDEIQKINKISGAGFQPIKVYMDGITDYEIDDMSNGKHLVIHLGNSNLTLIKWNFDGDWDELQDASMFGLELECTAELQMGFIARTFMLQGIIDWLHVKE